MSVIRSKATLSSILKYNEGVLETKTPAEILRDYHRAYPFSDALLKEFLGKDLVVAALPVIDEMITSHNCYRVFLRMLQDELVKRLKQGVSNV